MAGGLIGLLHLPISLGLGPLFPRGSVSLQHFPCTTPQVRSELKLALRTRGLVQLCPHHASLRKRDPSSLPSHSNISYRVSMRQKHSLSLWGAGPGDGFPSLGKLDGVA